MFHARRTAQYGHNGGKFFRLQQKGQQLLPDESGRTEDKGSGHGDVF
jgi:hypothetical protein